jgi:hypothetical protein
MKQIFVNGVSHDIEKDVLSYQDIAELARIPNPGRISYVQPMRGSTRGGGVLQQGTVLPVTSAMNFIVLAQEALE